MAEPEAGRRIGSILSHAYGLVGPHIWLRLFVLSALLAVIELAVLFALRFFFLEILRLSGGEVPIPQFDRLMESPAAAAIVIVAIVLALRFALSLVIARGIFSTVLGEQARITGRLFASYLARSYHADRDTASSQHVQTILLTVTRMVNQFLLPLAQLMGEALVALAIFVVLLVMEPLASLAVAAWLALFFGLVALATRRRAVRAGNCRWNAMNAMRDTLDGALGDIRVVRLAAAEERFARTMDREANAHADAIVEENVIDRWPQYARDLGLMSAIGVALLVFLAQGRDAAGLSAGLVLFGAGAFRLLPAIHRLTAFTQKLYLQAPDLDRVVADLDHATENLPASTGDGQSLFSHELSFAGLQLVLPDQREPLLRDVSLTIRKGEHVAISGPSGSGKSTLLLVLCGLLRSATGTIRADGVPVTDLLARIRTANVALVPQDAFIADMPLNANLAFPHDPDNLDSGLAEHICKALSLPNP